MNNELTNVLQTQHENKMYFDFSYVCKIILMHAFFLFLFCSCATNDENSESGELITFSMSNNDKIDVKYHSLALDTPSDIVVSDITSLECVDDRIFILDYKLGLTVFGKDGKYITNIGKRGNGRGEYISPSSLSINKEKGIVSVIDDQKGDVINYDLYNYTYVNNSPIPVISYNMEFLGDIVVFKNNDYTSKTSDVNKNYFIYGNNKFVKSFSLKAHLSGFGIGPSDMLYRYKGNIRAFAQHSPNVYNIDKNGSLSIKYKIKVDDIDYAPHAFMNKISKTKSYRTFYKDLTESNYISYSSVAETEKDLLFVFIQNKIRYFGVYNKLNKSVKTICADKFMEDNKFTFDYYCGVIDNQYVFAFERDDGKSLLNDKPYLSDEFIAGTSNSGNNLMLIFVTF